MCRRLELARRAVTDKLYVSPAIDTVNWANESGYQAYLYIHNAKVSQQERDFSVQCTLWKVYKLYM